MRGAGARAWGAGWKDDLPRAIAVEIPGLGVEPVERAGSQRLAGAGEAWPGAPQAAIGRRRNGCLEWGVAWKRADRVPAVWGFDVQALRSP